MDSFDKAELSLYNSVNTATPPEDIHAFTDTAAPYVKNTGIERDGGITNLYQKESTYPDVGNHYITEDGTVIAAIPSGDNRLIKVDDHIVSSVSAYGVESRTLVAGADDTILTADDTYVSIVVSGADVVITEYDLDAVQLNQRTVTFSALTTLTEFVTSVSIVRYNIMHYVDSFEFAVRLGDQFAILKESTPGQTIVSALQSTSVLGTNQVNDVIVYGAFLVCAGVGGRVGSFDGTSWRNYDGSGAGAGPFADGTAIGTNDINKLAVYNNSLVCGGAGGRIGSFDGSVWRPYNTAGTGLWNNSTVISTDNVTAMQVWTFGGVTHLIVGGHLGKLGEWDGTAWNLYSGAVGIRNNATLIGAVQINAIAIYTEYEGSPTILVAGASGRVGSFKYQSGASYSFATTSVPGGTWRGIAYGNGVFVAVAYTTSTTAGIATSPDGLTWTFQTLPSAPAAGWLSVAYDNGLFVAVANTISTTAGIATSPDGITWTFQTLPSSPASGWRSVTYGNGLFVAVAQSISTTAGIATSPNGITWTFQTLPSAPAAGWLSVAYGNGLFVAVAQSASTTASIATSPDGITWTFRTTTAPANYWVSVAYGNGLFVAVAQSISTTASIATSPDGITWTFRTTTAPGAIGWRNIAYGNGLFVAVAGTTSTTAGIATSPDGITWTFRTTTAPANNWNSVAYGNGLFVAIAIGTSTTAGIARSVTTTFVPSIYTTASGALFPTNNGTVVSTDSILSITNYDDRAVVTGSLGKIGELGLQGIWTNYNNIHGLSQRATVITPRPSNIWRSVTYGNGLFVAAAYTTSTTAGIATSPDGITWTFQTLPSAPAGAWDSITYGNGLFVAIATTLSTTAGIATSPDGITWTFQTLPSAPAGNWTGVTYGNGLFVAVAYTTSTTAGLVTSPDGINWTFQTTTAPAGNWLDITYGNGLFVAVAYTTSTTAGIATSPDGITWTFQTIPAHGYGWRSVTYGNGLFVAIAYTVSTAVGIATSPDGITWTFQTTPAPAAGWSAVTYGNGLFVAVADTTSTTAGLVTSPDGINWTFQTTTAPGGGWTSITYGNGLFIAMANTTSTTAGLFNFRPAITNNATVLGAVAINASTVFNNKLIVGGAQGRLGSWDGNYWRNYDGTGDGTGPYSNATVVGTNNITSMAVYNTYLAVGAAASTLGSINADGSVNLFYTDGGVPTANLLTGQSSNSFLYCYRYGNGYYLINLVGNTLSRSYTLNNDTKVITTLNAAYALPQVKNGVTRHILTTYSPDYTTVATEVKAVGVVGYTDFVTWTGVTQYLPAIYTLGNGNVLSVNCGPGYQDFTFQTTASATDIFSYYSPQYLIQPSSLYNVVQSNTDTLINAYGKLNNQFEAPSTKPFEFRVGLIPTDAGTGGQLSYLSAALVDSKSVDILGVLLTQIGEYDSTYLPMINPAEDTLMYRSQGKFSIIKIGKNLPNAVQQIGGGIYKINTLSPLNILDTTTLSLSVGSSDYNGRMIFSSTAAPTTSSLIASTQSSEYSNSIDVGDKLVTINPITNNNYDIVGYRIPNVTTVSSYAVDTYVNDLYVGSTYNDGSELFDPDKANLIYTNTPATPKIVPIAMGLTYDNLAVYDGFETYVLEQNNPSNPVVYDGYRIGNTVVGTYKIFSLNNGSIYLFDGLSIYGVTVGTAGFISNRKLIAGARGLRFIALAPSKAFFLSSFDNSIYVFEGGQSLYKYARMNEMSSILNGIYNVRDNALLLQTTDELIWLREGVNVASDTVLTVNPKLADQTDLILNNTSQGIIVSNDLKSWEYSFFDQSGATVVPLEWQSAYFGRTVNQKSILSEVVYTIYDRTKSRHTIHGYVYTRDPDVEDTQHEEWLVTPNMYTSSGYVTLRMRPRTPKSLGTSFGIACNDKITILDATIMFANDVNAVVDQKRSR